MNNYTINNNQLTFLDTRYYKCGEDGYVPSVTTILESYPKGAAYYEWLKKHGEDSDNIRDEAGRRGSVVHNLTERYDNGEEVSLINNHGVIDFKISEWSMFEKYVDFRNRFPAEIFYQEKNIISEKLGFAGTLDRVMNIEGKTLLVDIKTSGAIYNSYWLQLAAYEQLLLEENGHNILDGVAVLWLNAKTRTEGKKGQIQGVGWQLVTKEENDQDWELFKATHQLWLAENGDSKPKQLTYQLKHKL
jgi:hypothetical protein